MDFEVNIDQKVIDRIQAGLVSAVDDSLKQGDIDSVASQMLSTILLRTRRGRYLTQKTGGGDELRRYRSESWKKQRAKKGLETGRVTLFYGEGGLLEGMRARGRSVGGNVELEAGYIPGLSESRATEIARYMNDQGVGTNRVFYRYVGFTRSEEDRIVSSLRQRIEKNIKDQAK